jgi:hypothetical protein
MKKTYLYILLLLILGFGVYYFLFKEHDAFDGDEAGFTIADTASIGKIFMADKKGNTLLLERKTEGWVVNNKYPSLEAPINGLLSTLHSQVAQFPVPQQAYNNVITILAGNSVKIELYDRAGDKIKAFYVGGQANDNTGSYMLMEGATTPYVVNIPGFTGYITPRYSTDIADWRDRMVFNAAPAHIKSVTVRYDNEPLNSFEFLSSTDGKFSVNGDSMLIRGQQINARRVEVYSKFFQKVYCEGYINGVYKLDSLIKNADKYCSIDVVSKDGKQQRADVYWMAMNKRSKNMLTPMPGVDSKYDADRFYAVINGGKDTVIIQRMTFDKIFRKAWEFYTPDDTAKQHFVVPKDAGKTYRKASGN